MNCKLDCRRRRRRFALVNSAIAIAIFLFS